jgi:uncharacterized protein YigA (DUF484 family)
MWGDQLGPVALRRMRSVALFLQEHPEFEDEFKQDMLAGREPGLTVHQRCALEAAEMDRADRAETRMRSERLAQRQAARANALLSGQIVARSHEEVLQMLAMLP